MAARFICALSPRGCGQGIVLTEGRETRLRLEGLVSWRVRLPELSICVPTRLGQAELAVPAWGGGWCTPVTLLAGTGVGRGFPQGPPDPMEPAGLALDVVVLGWRRDTGAETGAVGAPPYLLPPVPTE